MYKRQVIITEYERGWGQRVDEIEYYDSDEAALKRIKEFNANNKDNTVPDWYMSASLGDVVDV